MTPCLYSKNQNIMNAILKGNILDQNIFFKICQALSGHWKSDSCLKKYVVFSYFLKSYSNNKHNKEKHTKIYKELTKYDIYPAIILNLYILGASSMTMSTEKLQKKNIPLSLKWQC